MSIGTIEVVLPAHNEGEGIALTLREFYKVVAEDAGIPIKFVVCEDGSKDNTVQVIEDLSLELPIQLMTSTQRKGYSRAVVDGLKATTSEYVAFIDSDGQCDPKDFANLVANVSKADLVIGYRNPRHDSTHRLVMSKAFKTVYERLFPVRLKDPSCPFLVVRRSALEKILQGNLGVLKQGFWWEFNARAKAHGVTMFEVPVSHRERFAGETQVYLWKKIPRIAIEHLRALFSLRSELKQIKAN